MTQDQALRAARKLYGKTARVKLQEHALPAAERAKLPPYKDLPPDERWKLSARRCSVGHIELGLFFSVEGQGDNWAEAVRAAQAHRAGLTA